MFRFTRVFNGMEVCFFFLSISLSLHRITSRKKCWKIFCCSFSMWYIVHLKWFHAQASGAHAKDRNSSVSLKCFDGHIKIDCLAHCENWSFVCVCVGDTSLKSHGQIQCFCLVWPILRSSCCHVYQAVAIRLTLFLVQRSTTILIVLEWKLRANSCTVAGSAIQIDSPFLCDQYSPLSVNACMAYWCEQITFESF